MHTFPFYKTRTRVAVRFGIAAAILLGAYALAACAQEAPKYRVDPFWPQELPSNWIIGQIGGLAVDREDHIWVLQRPASNTVDEIGDRHVLKFKKDGHFLKQIGHPSTDPPSHHSPRRIDVVPTHI